MSSKTPHEQNKKSFFFVRKKKMLFRRFNFPQSARIVNFSASRFSSTTTTSEEEKPDLSVVSTAAAISRSLRKYREDKSTNNNNNNGNEATWVDVEQLLSSKYLSRMDLTDKKHDPSGTSTSSILRPIQIAEEILSGSSVFKSAGLELKPQLVVRLRNTRSSQAHVFLDSEHFASPEECVNVFTSLNILPDHSTLQVVRQPHQKQSSAVNSLQQKSPSQHFRNFGKRLCELAQMSPHRYSVGEDISVFSMIQSSSSNGSTDATDLLVVAGTQGKRQSASEYNAMKKVKNYMLVEKLAAQLFASQTVTLSDIIYVCSDENFDLYCNHVAKSTPFYDAEVFVYSPSFSKKIVF
jgi:hypothetical protein